MESIDVATNPIRDSGCDAQHAHAKEQNCDLHISAGVGETSVLKYTASPPGTYKFFCSAERRKQAGMIGELTVLDQE